MPIEPIVFEDVHRERFATKHVSQDAAAISTMPEATHAWHLRIAWDGSAAGLLRAFNTTGPGFQLVADTFFEEAVRPPATLVEKAARRVGGYGRAHVVLRLHASDLELIHRRSVDERTTRRVPEPNEMLPIQRWADGGRGSTPISSTA